MTESSSRPTALLEVHQQLGASLTDFAGWLMPLRYGSDLAEHRAVREACGVFDLSHMGEISVTGERAGEALDYALAGQLSAVKPGRAKYSLLLNEDGGIIDDLIVYNLTAEDEGAELRYLVVANAANSDRVASVLQERCSEATVEDQSSDWSLIAVQGPEAERHLIALSEQHELGVSAQQLHELRYYAVLSAQWRGSELLIARTGYTGEDGFECYVSNEHATSLWRELERSSNGALQPCGLACRDTLRLEAGMPLYGHELSESTKPAQAGLGRVVSFKKTANFVGRSALEGADLSEAPVLVGLRGEGRRAPRAGYAVVGDDGETLGEITSGVLSPTLGHPIAMAYVDPSVSAPGTELSVDVRGKLTPVVVTALPFYKR